MLSLAMLASPIYTSYPILQPYATHTSLMFGLNNALNRIVWSISLCYIIFACVHNAGGFVNWFLSHSYWGLFSKLSYVLTVKIRITAIFEKITAIKTLLNIFEFL